MKLLLIPLSVICVAATGKGAKKGQKEHREKSIVTLGPRPYQLVDSMDPSFLKTQLETCADEMEEFHVSDFSIGHRGAAMQFPEHTLRSYKAAQLMGAGINECDVTFTKDLQLVCRHSQCDLHTTTDVAMRPEMNAKCSTPWTPGPWEEGAAPNCCTSDFTLEEIKTLCAKMDSTRGESAITAEEYVYGGTADWRTDIYQNECPKVPTHAESIESIQEYGGKFTPELKEPSVEMPFNGVYTQQDFAQQMIDEYITAGIPPEDVWPQSFSAEDCYYWITKTEYGEQAVALDGVYDRSPAEVEAWHKELSANKVRIVAPPLWMLVDAAPERVLKMKTSHYVQSAHENNLDIIAWTLERTDPGLNGWYWQSLANVALVDGDKYALLYVLAFDAKVLGVFSDWPATVTFFANCMGLSLR